MTTQQGWPALAAASWAPTRFSLHRYAQMLGKLRLALAPYQPNFTFTSLALTPRGFTTGTMPHGRRAVDATVDVFDASLTVRASDGEERRISLAAPTTVSTVYAAFCTALAQLGVDVDLSPIPQEVSDATPLDRDDRPAELDANDAARWLTVLAATNAVFDRWRAHFSGRMGIHLWWGAFDFAVLLFSGKHVPPPTNRGYLLTYDLDAEMMNAGFYPGDDASEPYFYAYIYPEPAACGSLSLDAPGASWSTTLGEWVLPYEALRTAADPDATLTAFLDGVYRLCGSAAGWPHDALRYAPPPLRRAPASAS